jgi:2-C-methyl-D-erythritol 4-phosphate cytidylyltransferase/2-C-methyl-D-erythritol 2,4-cyclodiphosphate synthase
MAAAGDAPKQYQLLGEKTILQHAISAFARHAGIAFVQVVIHRDDEALYRAAVEASRVLLPPVFGGKTRQQSALAGLRALQSMAPEKVLIHDAARPFVSSEIIDGVLARVDTGICALPALAVSDTIKKVAESGSMEIEETVKRDNLFLAQTPQGFMFSEILDAHEQAALIGSDDFTDDISIGEWAGMKAVITMGSNQNRKITTRDDLEMANNQMANGSEAADLDIRTGNGYDVHRLVADEKGQGIILCGITVPFDRRLDGHSDADVALHALTDALLGTIGAGDIGSHFPPSDDKWRDASSDRFLQHACKLVRESHGRITHLDVTIICEAPKIGPHREKMCARIAQICDLDVSRVSVKATTHERIGTIGREEGIAALATASVVMRTT